MEMPSSFRGDKLEVCLDFITFITSRSRRKAELSNLN